MLMFRGRKQSVLLAFG